jgi:AAA+ ATPase superfamily predicted ATPase
MPFGESVRTTKKILYRIQDPTMRFWFRVYSPHRSRWMNYTAEERNKLIHDHASSVFEDACRARFPGATRYWEKDIELDLVAEDPQNAKCLVVAEAKWRKLSAAERRHVLVQLEARWKRTTLSQKHPKVRFEVFDATAIKG